MGDSLMFRGRMLLNATVFLYSIQNFFHRKKSKSSAISGDVKSVGGTNSAGIKLWVVYVRHY